MRWMARLSIVLLVAGLSGCADEAAEVAGAGATTPPSTPTQTETVTPSQEPSASPSTSSCAKFDGTDDVSSDQPLTLSSLTGKTMRVGKHECFERFVFEMAGSGDSPGWTVGYRDPISSQGSGDPIQLAGDADLQVTIGVWTVSDFEGRPDDWPPFEGPDDLVTSGFTALQEARNLYAYEGVTQIGLGIDRQRPFRVSWQQDPPRLVVDISTH